MVSVAHRLELFWVSPVNVIVQLGLDIPMAIFAQSGLCLLVFLDDILSGGIEMTPDRGLFRVDALPWLDVHSRIHSEFVRPVFWSHLAPLPRELTVPDQFTVELFQERRTCPIYVPGTVRVWSSADASRLPFIEEERRVCRLLGAFPMDKLFRCPFPFLERPHIAVWHSQPLSQVFFHVAVVCPALQRFKTKANDVMQRFTENRDEVINSLRFA